MLAIASCLISLSATSCTDSTTQSQTDQKNADTVKKYVKGGSIPTADVFWLDGSDGLIILEELKIAKRITEWEYKQVLEGRFSNHLINPIYKVYGD